MSMNRIAPVSGTQTPSSAALVAIHQPTTAPATLLSVLCSNRGAAQFLQVWDAKGKTDPSAVLLWSFAIPESVPFCLDTPIVFLRGILLRVASAETNTVPELAADTSLGGNCRFLTRHI